MKRKPDLLSSVVSQDLVYRYSFTRIRYPDTPRATAILLNPVSAGDYEDPTTGAVMRCLCEMNGFGVVEFVNLFAYRLAADTERQLWPLVELAAAGVDVIGPANDNHIRNAILNAELVVVAWGNWAERVSLDRADQVLSWVGAPYCLGYNGTGAPMHPQARVKGGAVLQPYKLPAGSILCDERTLVSRNDLAQPQHMNDSEHA